MALVSFSTELAHKIYNFFILSFKHLKSIMQKLFQLLQDANKPYKDFWARCLLALLAGHYILSNSRHYGFFEVMTVDGYWLSLAGSVPIAFLIIQLVYHLTVKLDGRMPYHINRVKRIQWQILLGIGLVAAVAPLLAYIFFLIAGQTQRMHNYFVYDYPIIVAFIVLVNGYYLCRYLIQAAKMLSLQFLLLKKYNRRQYLQLLAIQRATDIEEANQIAYIIRMGRHYLIKYLDGTTKPWFKPLRTTIQSLPSEEFMLINNQCIINRATIIGHETISSKRYRLLMKSPFDQDEHQSDFIVSQGMRKQFLKWIKADYK